MSIETCDSHEKVGAILTRLRFLLLILSLVVVTPSLAVAQRPNSQLPSDAEVAAEAAIRLSELESEGRASALYRRLHPDAKEIIPKEAVVGWYETDFFPLDPQPIIEITGVEFVTWTWPVTGEAYRNTAEVSYVQPFGSGANVTYTEDVVRLVEDDGDWHWFFGRSRDFVDTQIARFADDLEEDQLDRRRSSSPQEDVQSSGECTVVQLYPGYPGYRGNVTGVMAHWGGQGDYECLEVLEAENPEFKKRSEDRANQRAADELGIEGSMDVWTWENWIQIEAERGMTPSCYTCLMFDDSTEPMNIGLHPDNGDIRILTGLEGGTLAIDSILIELYGHTSVANVHAYFGHNDYVLRSLAYLSDSTLNAEELYQSMMTWVQSALGPSGGSSLVDYEQVLALAIWDRGGYVVVPDEAHSSDQFTLMYFAVAVASTQLSDEWQTILMQSFETSVAGWDRSGRTVPLDSYLQQDAFWRQYAP